MSHSIDDFTCPTMNEEPESCFGAVASVPTQSGDFACAMDLQ